MQLFLKQTKLWDSSDTPQVEHPQKPFYHCTGLVLPVLQYGLPAWYLYTTMAAQLEQVQRRATRMILKQPRGAMPYKDLRQTLNWLSLKSRIIIMPKPKVSKTPIHVFPRIWSHLPMYNKDLLLESFQCFIRKLHSHFLDL